MTENPGIPSPVPLDIRYLEPLLKAWHRMRRILFAPFAIGQYLLLGFTAWLAGLLDGQGGGGGRRFEFKNEGPIEIVDKINEFLQQIGVAWARFTARPFWAALAIFIVLLAITVILVLLWLTSRAKFIYLDNVVRGRARFFEPWHAYAAQGNSLFLFRIGFGLIVFLVIVGLIMLGLGSGIFCLTMRSAVSILSLIMIVIFMLAFIACMAYVQLFTESFVMPIMYKYRLGALEAWRYFMPWLRAAGIYFFLYGLFVLALFVLTAVAVVILGLATCCIGIIVMMIPYINTLVLLPLHVTYRALSLEFLAQFDPRFDLFAPPAPVPAEPVAP